MKIKIIKIHKTKIKKIKEQKKESIIINQADHDLDVINDKHSEIEDKIPENKAEEKSKKSEKKI